MSQQKKKEKLEEKLRKVEISEKEFLKGLFDAEEYYLQLYAGVKGVIEEVEFYKSIGYKIKYYKLGDQYSYEVVDDDKRIGFRIKGGMRK